MPDLGNRDACPGPELVALRAEVLAARAVHAMAWPSPDLLPGIVANWSVAERDQFEKHFEESALSVRNALKKTGAWACTTPDEQRFFLARLTERTTQQCIDSSWGVESLACCLWALFVLQALPAYDSQASAEIARLLPATDDGLALRSDGVLERAREHAETWYRRSRIRKLIESGQPVPAQQDDLTIDQLVRLAAESAAEDGHFERCDDDFGAFGKAYRDLSPEEYAQAASIATERRKAFNWICGYAPNNRWELTPTDT